MRKSPHIFHITPGRRAINELQGVRIQADSVFQTCLHLAFMKVFGYFPIVSEAVFMGFFQKIFSSSMEFSGTSEMKRFAEKLVTLDVSSQVPEARLAADKELPGLLLAAAQSHHRLTRFAKHGFITPNRLFAWFRTFTFHPLRLVTLLSIALVPRPIRKFPLFQWIASALRRTPLLSRMLAYEAFDVSSSHLPAMPGLRAGVLQNCNFDRVPSFITPDIDLPELLGGVYRPKLLVHYSIYDNQVNLSPLFFNPETRAQRDLFVQTLEFYLRVCASICEASRAQPRTEASSPKPSAAAATAA
jgi:hypothetical protein